MRSERGSHLQPCKSQRRFGKGDSFFILFSLMVICLHCQELFLGSWWRRAGQKIPHILWHWKVHNASHSFLSRATWIQSTPSYYISSRAIIFLQYSWWHINLLCPHARKTKFNLKLSLCIPVQFPVCCCHCRLHVDIEVSFWLSLRIK